MMSLRIEEAPQLAGCKSLVVHRPSRKAWKMGSDASHGTDMIGEPACRKKAMQLPVKECGFTKEVPACIATVGLARLVGKAVRSWPYHRAEEWHLPAPIEDDPLATAFLSLNQGVAVLQPPALDAFLQASILTSFTNVQQAAG